MGNVSGVLMGPYCIIQAYLKESSMNILEQIVADKRLEIAALKKAVPECTLVLPREASPDFVAALRAQPQG